LEPNLKQIYEFLLSAEAPSGLDESQKKNFLRTALKFFAQGGHLWKKRENGCHIRVPTIEERQQIMDSCHNEVGHKGIYSTRYLLTSRYWWPTVYKDVANFVRTCHECQIRATIKPDAKLTVQEPIGLFRKVHLDAMLMPKSGGYRYVLAA
jgi:Integrase zinc binding domain